MLRTEFAQLREQAGISIKDLANEAGFTQRTLYRWEKGEAVPRKAVMTLLQNKIAIMGNGQCKFRFIDLFAGIGGLRRGFDRIGGQCVFTSEWHGFACETQGNLFFDVARIIRYHRPRCFLLENVKNLVSHDRGRTFSIIRNVLEHELGYCLHWRIIDGKGFVPQHRERIFIVGFLDKNDFSFDTLSLPDPLSGPRLSAILHSENGSEKPESHYTVGKKASVSEKYTLSDKLWKYLQNYADKHKKAGNGFGFGLCDHDSVARTLSARYYKDGSEILVSQGCDKNPRRLTPRECARLMGFDRPGQSDFKIPVSDTQAYRQFGNAVVVPVVEAVASHILPHLQN